MASAQPVMKKTPTTRPQCGKYAGYAMHQRHGEQPCAECRAAATAYVRDLRRRKPEPTRAANLATHRASARLRRAHPAEWAALYAEEHGKARLELGIDRPMNPQDPEYGALRPLGAPNGPRRSGIPLAPENAAQRAEEEK